MKRFILGAAVALALITSVGAEQTFSTPEEACKAMKLACAADDGKAVLDILGPSAAPLVKSVDPQQDRQDRKRLAQAADKYSSLETGPKGSRIWVVGTDLWPFPFPLVKAKDRWRFDTQAGLVEMTKRRVGRDELAIIQLLQEMARAQWEYASVDRNGDGVREYAQMIRSTPGQHDGLYWEADSSGPSPMEAFVDSFKDYVKGKSRDRMWMGYRMKLLRGQGAQAPGGNYSYFVNGRMLLGFAVVAYPADYGRSGITSFMMNQSGKILEKDLGPDGARIAEAMAEYNPDKSWMVVPPSGIHAASK